MEILIKKGDRGEDVKKIQQKLHLYPDGIFGDLTEEAVRDFQTENGLLCDGIVGKKTYIKLFGSILPTKRKITKIILHCSATQEGKDVKTEAIRKFHIKNRGWKDIGYHFVIELDGSVHNGRDINISGAHCTGHNADSIGICYVGGLDSKGKPKDTRNEKQIKALNKLVRDLMEQYDIPLSHVFGHYQFANKACPCFKIEQFRNNLYKI